MRSTFRQKRPYTRIQALLIACVFCVSLIPQQVEAIEQDATFQIKPHCLTTGDGSNDEWLFGPIPSPDLVIETSPEGNLSACDEFIEDDPETQSTPALRVGDILDIDIVIQNPSQQNIQRVRAWLSYDPNILEGELIEISGAFPIVTPGESDFSESDGYVMIEAVIEEDGPSESFIRFAHVQFRVKKTTPSGSPISFYDAQRDGHSMIMATDGTEEEYVLANEPEPGILRVVFTEEEEEIDSEEDMDMVLDEDSDDFDMAEEEDDSDMTEEEKEEEELIEVISQIDEGDTSCQSNADCASGLCVSEQCVEKPGDVSSGGSCTENKECESNLCASGICIPSLAKQKEAVAAAQKNQRTAFSLLQIRNVRVTTEGSSVFLAWDPLQSSTLKAYNVYYGTVSGRYIQRKTIPATTNSLTLRSLPVGTTYYFAVRAVSTTDEESAFSQEVSVITGNPASASAPLSPGSVQRGPGGNPLQAKLSTGDTTVPGETGLSSTVALFIIASAIIGTFLASRRQYVINTNRP